VPPRMRAAAPQWSIAASAPAGMRMLSTSSCTDSGGAAVTLDTPKATAKFTIAPTTPKALGSIPRNQFAGESPRKAVPLAEDTHHQRREDRRGGEAEGQGNGPGGESRWIEAKVAGAGDRDGHRHARGIELGFLADVRRQHALDQVVRDRRGDRQQQTRRRRQGRGDTAGGDQCDHPARKLCDFRVGQHEDVTVEGPSSLTKLVVVGVAL
jgi:hypothetical protein